MNKLKPIVFLVLSSFLLFQSCSSKKTLVKKAPITIDFQFNEDISLTDLLEVAEKQNKLVFLDFHAEWCLPCKLMDESLFTEKSVYNYINDNFISYKVDVEKANGANLRMIFNATELPTMLFLNTDGRVLERNDGTILRNDLLALAARALDKA